MIDRLTNENATLRAERDGLMPGRDKAARLGDGVSKSVARIAMRSFEEAIEAITSSAPAFGGTRAALC